MSTPTDTTTAERTEAVDALMAAGYGYRVEHTMTDGRIVSCTIEIDQDSSLLDDQGDGWWCGRIEWSHPGRYQDHAPRPDGMTGRARIIERDGSSRLWWQPPTDVEDIDGMRRIIMDILEYGYVGIVVELIDGPPDAVGHRPRVDDASLWGIEAMVDDAYRREVIGNLLREVIG